MAAGATPNLTSGELADIRQPDLFRPSLFETAAAEGINNLLRLSFDHVWRVVVEHNASLVSLAPWSSEIYSCLRYLLEAHSLRETGASFAENMYGMTRFRVPASASVRGPVDPSCIKELDVSDCRRALFFLVVAPYLRRRMDRYFVWLTRSMVGMDGPVGAAAGAVSPEDFAFGVWVEDPLNPPRTAQVPLTVVIWRRAFAKLYPWFHGLWELSLLAWELAYAFRIVDFATPALAWLGQTLRRLSAADLAAQYRGSIIRQDRAWQRLRQLRQAARADPSGGMFSRRIGRPVLAVLATLGYLVRFHGKWAVALGVLGIQVLQWWYSPAGPRNLAEAAGRRNGTVLPHPPPPPPVPRPASGLQLPADRTLCGLCNRPRTNPASTPAGYVFCYPCIYDRLQREGRCPVSLLKCDPEQLRRVFES